MREGSRRGTGLLSVYYYPLSAPKCAFCFDGLARGPLRAPRTPDAIPFSLQQPIPLYPLFPSPLPFAVILLLSLSLIAPLLTLLPLRPTASSYSPSPTFLLLHPPSFSLSFSYYTITTFLFLLPSHSSIYDGLIPLKRRPCARVRCAHGATKQKGEWEK